MDETTTQEQSAARVNVSGRTSHGRAVARLIAIWRVVLDFALVLWVVRIPLASVVLGLLLMGFVTQAQDVMVDVAMAGAPLARAAGISGAMLGLAAGVFILWAMPVHYAGRLLLETDAGLAARVRPAPARRLAASGTALGWMICLVPRVLGALTFLAFVLGAWRAIVNLPTLEDASVVVAARAQLALLGWVMLAGAPVFYIYAVVRARLTRVEAVARLDRWLGEKVAPIFRWLGIAPRPDDTTGELHATGRLTLLAYGLVVVLVLALSPLWLANALPLAFAIPLIFGGWVPLLSYLASIGRRFHFPFVTALLVAGVVGIALFGDNHAVRTLEARQLPAARPSLQAAIAQWMAANDCAGRPEACPRPVIVAAAGGASRAGFFTASVLGHFLDFEALKQGFAFTRADQTKVERGPRDDGRFSEEAAARLTGADVARRIFAISGVSGGSYGAAVTAAALSARVGPAGPPPCPSGPQPYWFGASVHTWADCLEALTGGDYLTATFFGLAFHDQVQLFLEDRAALLEQAWERRFKTIVGAGQAQEQASQVAAQGEMDAPPPGPAERLSEPFLIAGERSAGHWVPFLVLNGTSVETGQRVVTTDFAPVYKATHCPNGAVPDACPIFTHALDFHSLMGGGRDVALSTAATNSARFPIISPPGSVVHANGNIVDRIVDGGYFENYGAQSAMELAQAMVELESGLAPFVLVISNDPQSALTDEAAAHKAVMPDAPDHIWLPEAAGPLGAISTVRGGRGRLAVAELESWLDRRFGAHCPVNLAHIKVWPEALDGTCPLGRERTGELRDISMSWWLSKPVQMNLREQIEPSGDACNNDAAVASVWTAFVTPSSACTAAPGR